MGGKMKKKYLTNEDIASLEEIISLKDRTSLDVDKEAFNLWFDSWIKTPIEKILNISENGE